MPRSERHTHPDGYQFDRVYQDNGRITDFIITPDSYFKPVRSDRKQRFNKMGKSEIRQQKVICNSDSEQASE
ncbi:MAG: hypothetical protein WDZ94_00145 [Patescibacteria group bacterium]